MIMPRSRNFATRGPTLTATTRNPVRNGDPSSIVDNAVSLGYDFRSGCADGESADEVGGFSSDFADCRDRPVPPSKVFSAKLIYRHALFPIGFGPTEGFALSRQADPFRSVNPLDDSLRGERQTITPVLADRAEINRS